MDITLFSSIPKESHHHHHHHHHHRDHHDHDHQYLLNNNNTNKHQMVTITTTNINDRNSNNITSATTISGVSSDSAAAPASEENWARRLLTECATAISENDSSKTHHLLWTLNELSSPYGDLDQKLASSFLQALFCRATASGHRRYQTLAAVAERRRSFEAARRLILSFQEASPWTTFGHVASNGAILEALAGEQEIHVIDASDTLCTQWPTLLEALATRTDDTPSLRLTVIDPARSSLIKEVGQRIEKFARLMAVPFQFNIISKQSGLTGLTREAIGVRDGEALAVNCIRDLGIGAIQKIGSLRPKVLTVVEEEADFAASGDRGFVARFEECLRFYTLYFDMLGESFPATSSEKLALERECSRGIVRVLACDDGGGGGAVDGGAWECERREKGRRWSERLRKVFSPARYSDDVVDDVKALLKRYQSGWGLVLPDQHQQQSDSGIYLTWKDEPVVWASAWKP